MSEKKKKSISFSEYSCYLQCPHKWYLNYYLRLPSETNEELIFGSTVHSTIEALLGSKLEQKMYAAMPEQTIRDIFKRCLKKELERVKDIHFLTKFNNKELGKIFMFQASKLLVKLDFFKRFKDYEVAEVEVKLDGMPIISTDEVDITYKGFVDLVLRHKSTGKLMILDWKTSGKAWDINAKMKDNENFFAQLCLYKYYYSQMKGLDFKQVSTKFYNLPRNEPENQSPYEGILTQDYTDLFFYKFQQTALKIYEHSKTLENFDKQKFLTKKNFCHRCNFNVPELCNDLEEHQKIDKLPPPPKNT
jgi:hypothetical protein